MNASVPKVLSIAGSDPSGGAGVQADLKTFTALGVYGMAAITSLTAQNTCGVYDIHEPSPKFLNAQLKAIFEDIMPDAVKIGMVHSRDAMEVVLEVLQKYNPAFTVLDPVMVSTSGHTLISDDSIDFLKNELSKHIDLITPNLHEAKILYGDDPNYETLSSTILLKGGHSDDENCHDVLYENGSKTVFEGKRIDTQNTHGTGCTLSSAIAANYAKEESLTSAIKKAKLYIQEAIKGADVLNVGSGCGPVNHLLHGKV